MHQQLGTLTARWLMDLFLGLLVTSSDQIESISHFGSWTYFGSLGNILMITHTTICHFEFITFDFEFAPHERELITEHAVGGRVGLPHLGRSTWAPKFQASLLSTTAVVIKQSRLAPQPSWGTTISHFISCQPLHLYGTAWPNRSLCQNSSSTPREPIHPHRRNL